MDPIERAREENERRRRELGIETLRGVRESARASRRLADEARRRGDDPAVVAIRERTARDAEAWYERTKAEYPDLVDAAAASPPGRWTNLLDRFRRPRAARD